MFHISLPDWAIRPLIYGGLILALCTTCFIKGCEYEQNKVDKLKDQAIIQGLHVQIKRETLTRQAEVQYVDRVKIIHEKGAEIIRAVPLYLAGTNSNCVVNDNFVRVWNAANSGDNPFSKPAKLPHE